MVITRVFYMCSADSCPLREEKYDKNYYEDIINRNLPTQRWISIYNFSLYKASERFVTETSSSFHFILVHLNYKVFLDKRNSLTSLRIIN